MDATADKPEMMIGAEVVNYHRATAVPVTLSDPNAPPAAQRQPTVSQSVVSPTLYGRMDIGRIRAEVVLPAVVHQSDLANGDQLFGPGSGISEYVVVGTPPSRTTFLLGNPSLAASFEVIESLFVAGAGVSLPLARDDDARLFESAGYRPGLALAQRERQLELLALRAWVARVLRSPRGAGARR